MVMYISLAFAQSVLPISMDIMREVQSGYRSGELEEYILLVTVGKELSEDDYQAVANEVNMFFESTTFLETGGAYLSALFTERELNEVLTVLRDSSLRDDPNYGGARKLEMMMQKLKPYIIKYLRHRVE
jgi:hypothetical protein